MNKRILVTGATGFIGRNAVNSLTARGYDVVALTSRPEAVLGDDVTILECDLLNPEAVAAAVSNAGAPQMLHLAWRTVDGGLWSAPESLDWLQASLGLAKAFLDTGGRRITVGGSCAEYDWTSGVCREGATPMTPSTLYGASKHALFMALSAYCKARDAELAWGRVFFVYGPGEHPSRLGASVALSLLQGGEARCSHGRQLRDYMHVADVGAGLAALADSDLIGDYNLASGDAIQVMDLIHALADVVGARDRVRLGAIEPPAHEPRLIVADMDKTLRANLDWSPKVSLRDGAADTVDWFRQNAAGSAPKLGART